MKDFEERLKSLEERVRTMEKALPKKKPQTEASFGVFVFQAYTEAYRYRYGTDPVRNAMVNKQCSTLVSRVGLDDAKDLVKFYVEQNDPFYQQKYHPIGLCLSDCEGLLTRLKTGMKVTKGQADKLEKGDASVKASEAYIRRKHGAPGA